MYAIFESGGQQHKGAEGDILQLELLDVEPGQTIEIDKVLLISKDGKPEVGKPYVANGKVSVEVLAHGRGDKIRVIKFRRRKHYQRTQGHRQWFTQVKVTGIAG